MLGLNGGLMGVLKVPTSGTASGLWFQNEQSVAQRAGIWPAVSVEVPVGSIAYSQSSVYSGTSAASNANMTDGSFGNDGTATNPDGPRGFVRMDLGAVYTVGSVVIGTATNAIPGGWSKTYTENRDVEYSTDDSSWTNAFNTNTFASNGIYTFSVSFNARYIRITKANDYVALSEFYALAPGQTYTP
jgi:hypothetical protein